MRKDRLDAFFAEFNLIWTNGVEILDRGIEQGR